MNRSKDIEGNQIISIVGATATGKTALALELAETLLERQRYETIHLLSADSRQVYQGLENLTGADLPTAFIAAKSKQYSFQFFRHPQKAIFIHGVSIISPLEEWSAAHFTKLFANIKNQLGKKDLLIVVGGTGFYQIQIGQEAATLKLAPNPTLRDELEKLSPDELQKRLSAANPLKYAQMNHSDRHNPRRLIRALELASTTAITTKVTKPATKHPTFYLQIDSASREQKIKTRVEQRFAKAKAEVAAQLQQKIGKLASSSTGFQELSQFIHGEIDQATCQTLWQRREIQYARRQDTWWKKQINLTEIKGSPNLDFVRQALNFMLNYLQAEV